MAEGGSGLKWVGENRRAWPLNGQIQSRILFNKTLPPRCVVNGNMALVDESYGSDDPVKNDSSEEEGQIVDDPDEMNGRENQR